MVSVFCDNRLNEVAVSLRSIVRPSAIATSDLIPERIPQIVEAGATVVLATVSQRTGWETSQFVRQLKNTAPFVSVYVIASTVGLLRGELHELADAWVDDLFLDSSNAAREVVLAVVRERLKAPPPERALGQVSKLSFNEHVKGLVGWILLNSYRWPTLESAADVLGTTSRTIGRTLARADAGTFRELRRVGMVTHILELATRRGLSPRGAAIRLGLRNAAIVSELRSRFKVSMDNTAKPWFRALPALYHLWNGRQSEL